LGRENCELQTLGNFDTKTSSWIKTPAEIRKLGDFLLSLYLIDHFSSLQQLLNCHCLILRCRLEAN